jgi:uncharacterized membrane protein
LLQRGAVWLLAATSIACLLSEFYRICPMRLFTLIVFVPALVVLTVWIAFDKKRGKQIFAPVIIGAVSGLVAAVSYDLFRLPFVFAKQWGLDGVVPALNLFNVFPAFGAMILGQAYPQSNYSLTAHLLGWAYHFSNGLTFGVMYLAMVGDPRKHHWIWAVVFAVGLELAMLFTPYTAAFGIPLGRTFVIVTLLAHSIFGVVLGLTSGKLWQKWSFPVAAQLRVA